MKIEKKDLEKSQVEFLVELSIEEFKPYIQKGVAQLAKTVKIEGFRPGKADFETLKNKVGEMTIVEEASHIAINKTLGEVIDKNKDLGLIGQPKVDLVKLAPDNPFIYKAVFATLPSIELGEYKGFKLKKTEIKVDENDIEKTLNELREMNVKEVIKDGEIIDTDKVLVDIQMFLDSVPVEGGQGKGTAIIIGKGYVVPGFDKELIGAKKNDVREFKLPYPKDFHQQNLAGKLVEFKVTIKEIFSRDIPELSDEMAKKVNFKNIEDLKKNIKSNLESQKIQEAKQKVEIEMMEKIISGSKFGDLPEVLIQHEAENMYKEMERDMTQKGGKIEDYLASLGKNKAELMLGFTPSAVKRLKSSLILREIIKAEKIEVEKKEVDEYIESLKKYYKADDKTAKELETQNSKDLARDTLVNRRVLDKLREWNIAGKIKKDDKKEGKKEVEKVDKKDETKK